MTIPTPEPNDPRLERICEFLWQILDACKAVLDDHDDECGCQECCDIQALLWQAEAFEAALTGNLFSWPGRTQRYADEARRAGRDQEAKAWDVLGASLANSSKPAADTDATEPAAAASDLEADNPFYSERRTSHA